MASILDIEETINDGDKFVEEYNNNLLNDWYAYNLIPFIHKMQLYSVDRGSIYEEFSVKINDFNIEDFIKKGLEIPEPLYIDLITEFLCTTGLVDLQKVYEFNEFCYPFNHDECFDSEISIMPTYINPTLKFVYTPTNKFNLDLKNYIAYINFNNFMGKNYMVKN